MPGAGLSQLHGVLLVGNRTYKPLGLLHVSKSGNEPSSLPPPPNPEDGAVLNVLGRGSWGFPPTAARGDVGSCGSAA